MKVNIWRRPVIGTCLLWFAVSFTLSVTASEDIVIHGGTIYTADKARPLAEALVARDGKLIHVGSLATAEQAASPDAKWIDASGNMLLFGLHDHRIIHFRADDHPQAVMSHRPKPSTTSSEY